MDIGNKTHAAILGVAAVAAISFLAFRMIPHRSAAVTSEQAGPTSHKAGAPTLPQDVTRDAFSHPALYHPPKKNGVAAQDVTFKDASPSADQFADNAIDDHASLSATGFQPLVAPLNPGENAGKGRQPDKKTTITLSLKAVIKATRPLAMIQTSSDKTPTVQTYSLGQMVGAGYTLTSIGDNSVVLTAKKKREIDLQVGGGEIETK